MILIKFYDYFKHPVPHIEDVVENLAKSRSFTDLDTREVFLQCRIGYQLQDLLTLATQNLKWVIGLCHIVLNLGNIFFNTDWHESFENFQLPFWLFMCIMDNMNIYTKTYKAHLDVLHSILTKSRNLNTTSRLDKCQFMKTSPIILKICCLSPFHQLWSSTLKKHVRIPLHLKLLFVLLFKDLSQMIILNFGCIILINLNRNKRTQSSNFINHQQTLVRSRVDITFSVHWGNFPQRFKDFIR